MWTARSKCGFRNNNVGLGYRVVVVNIRMDPNIGMDQVQSVALFASLQVLMLRGRMVLKKSLQYYNCHKAWESRLISKYKMRYQTLQ